MAPYQAAQISDWFLTNIDRESGDTVSNLKLQKLVYYAQSYHLAEFKAPLFDEDMEAWAHGPVVPSLYRKYQSFGWEAIPAPDTAHEFDERTHKFLQSILNLFNQFSAKRLEKMTHDEDPWKLARGSLAPEARSEKIIKKEDMRSFYENVLAG